MAEKEKHSLFGRAEEEVLEAMEALYKRQKRIDEKLDELITHVVALRTNVVQPGAGEVADSGDEDDGVPPLVKWALSQPWGVDLMHGLTDQQMIQGLVRTGFEWLKNKAAQAAANNNGGVPPATGGT